MVTLIVRFVALVLTVGAARDDPTKGKTESLYGEWVIMSVDTGIKGFSWLEKAAKGGVAFFTVDQIQVKGGREAHILGYRLIPTTTPMGIDISIEGKVMKGICRVQGGVLTLCVADSAAPRPTKFEVKPDPGGQGLFVLKRKAD